MSPRRIDSSRKVEFDATADTASAGNYHATQKSMAIEQGGIYIRELRYELIGNNSYENYNFSQFSVQTKHQTL
jgi:hypothetical protein